MGGLQNTSPEFQRLIYEVAREAIREPKGEEWCLGQSCNARPLNGNTTLFTEFLGENPLTGSSDGFRLKIVSLVSITQAEQAPSEDLPNKHYFVDPSGLVVVQTVPYPRGLRQLSNQEIDSLAETMSS